MIGSFFAFRKDKREFIRVKQTNLKPLTPGEVARVSVTERAFDTHLCPLSRLTAPAPPGWEPLKQYPKLLA